MHMPSAARIAASTVPTLILAAFLSTASAAPPVETEPTLTTADFRGLPPLTGEGYRIEPTVPVVGFFGQFTLVSNLGTLRVEGIDLLHQRVKEVKAAIALDKMSSSDVFVSALAKSTGQSVDAIGKAVTHPVDTIKNVPSGIGRLFGSITRTVSNVVHDDGGSSSVSDAIGISKARRQIAQQVGVDPYSTNPMISNRLDTLSKAAFAGGISIDVAFAVVSGGAVTAISFTKTVSNLAWELPPADIRARNQGNLAALGVSKPNSDALLNNSVYTPTMALALVEALVALDLRDGADAFTKLAAEATTEIEARFYINQLRLAIDYKKSERVDKLDVAGKLGVLRTGDRLFAPLPVDYLSWTEHVKAAVEGNRFAARDRSGWLTGTTSPYAREGLRDARFGIRDYVPLN